MTVKKAQDSEQTKAMKHGHGHPSVQVIHHYAPYPGAGSNRTMTENVAVVRFIFSILLIL